MGPGLEICLRVGFRAAAALAAAHRLPFVGVHHLEAHVLTARQARACQRAVILYYIIYIYIYCGFT